MTRLHLLALASMPLVCTRANVPQPWCATPPCCAASAPCAPRLPASQVAGAFQTAPDATPQVASTAQAAPDPYPAERHATIVRFFCLEGDVKADPLKKALADLSTKDAGCGFVGEPSTSSTRPDKHFFAIEAPASVPLADLIKALHKGSARVSELEWTLFRGLAAAPPSILGFSGRDCVIGMANDVRWFAFDPDGTAFYYLPGKLGAAKLADLYRKLFQPFEAGDVGKLARDTIDWPLEPPVDGAAAKRAEKAILKIDGVREAHVDAPAHALRVVVELDVQKASAPPGRGARAHASGPFVPRFETNALLNALETEHVSIARDKR
jgi:hypothetical protein